MNFFSKPVTALCGEIVVPGDKSISHRAIIFGAIAQGKTRITGFLEGEDCLATIKAFRSMGVRIEGPDAGAVTIHGVGKYGLKCPDGVIDCGNSGTSMRLLAGLLAAQSFDSTLNGDASLQKRPMARISRPLLQMGADIRTTAEKPPLFIHGGQSLQGITYEMPEASAQVKSCLLLAGMYAAGQTCVIEPGVTRDHTENMLTAFSYPVEKVGNRTLITAEGKCLGTEIHVPGDISSATFFIVAATIIPGSKLLVRQVGMNPTRTGAIKILQQMGANITVSNTRTDGGELIADLLVQSAPLRGITIPTDLVPLAIDEFPVLFIAAACAQGTTRLHGARELRSKESDRIAAMVTGLQQLAIEAQAFDDGVMIQGGTLSGGVVDSYHDHRIAMAFAIAGTVASSPITIKHCGNVATSFPTFIQTARSVKLAIEESHFENR